MMRFKTLVKYPADWMAGKGGESTVVLTSRIRLARNLINHPFPGWATAKQRETILKELRPAIESLPQMKDAFSQELSDLEALKKQVLVERHLISREQAARGKGSAAIVDRKQSLSLMLNEEDHLRMQSIFSGFHLGEAYAWLNKVDTYLEEHLHYAFDKDLGYLTACPTNLGTGMRASAMLHLPGLVLSESTLQVVKAINKLGLAVRGLYGEGTESLGNLFQVSNQSTLGENEEAIIKRLERVIGQVVIHETNARQKIIEDQPYFVRDQIGRAYGVLRNAHSIDSKEALTYLSMLRLGGDYGFFSEDTVSVADTLLLEIQPAHLQLHGGKKLSAEERDITRAEIIRAKLQNIPPPVTY